MSKINFARIGEGALNLFKQNGATIVGGLIMIGLGLLCKKLDIPVETVSNPYDSLFSVEPKKPDVRLVLIPNNTVESSVSAIANAAIKSASSYSKEQASKKIMDVLRSNKAELSDTTKQFAITSLRYIADSTSSSYTKEQIFNRIAEIGKGAF